MRAPASPTAVVLCLAAAMGLAASEALAQTQAGWRYWAPADGLQESHSRKIGSAPGGGVTVRHGLVKSVDVLDGYVVETIAEPRVSPVPDSVMASVHTLAGGEAWAVAEGVLKPEDVAFYFCDRERGESVIRRLQVNELGGITNWPTNFFGDQMTDIAEMQKAGIRQLQQRGKGRN